MVLISVDLPSPVCPACASVTAHISITNHKEKRTDDDDVELEPALEKLVFYLLRDGVEPDVRGRAYLFGHCVLRREVGEEGGGGCWVEQRI